MNNMNYKQYYRELTNCPDWIVEQLAGEAQKRDNIINKIYLVCKELHEHLSNLKYEPFGDDDYGRGFDTGRKMLSEKILDILHE
jgi:hypothetical protein